jgi:hypothetical protein
MHFTLLNVTTIMPPTKNPLLSQFTERPGPGNQKSLVLACKHCSWTGTNTHRAVNHIESDCLGYMHSSERPAKRQQTLQLGVQSLSHAKKQKLDSAAALAVYMGARPFALWEDTYMRKFIDLLSDSLYKPPYRQVIGGELLLKAYEDVRGKVLSLLDQQATIQFILDESPDINHRRMVNLSAVVPGFGSFYLENHHVGDKALTASFYVEWFLKKALAYCSDPNRISSLSTDTCATMRLTWTGLENHPLLKHAFFVPCDSHGLQLLIKDILGCQPFADTIAKAQTIVSTFHQAKKQYAILRTKQEKCQINAASPGRNLRTGFFGPASPDWYLRTGIFGPVSPGRSYRPGPPRMNSRFPVEKYYKYVS